MANCNRIQIYMSHPVSQLSLAPPPPLPDLSMSTSHAAPTGGPPAPEPPAAWSDGDDGNSDIKQNSD